MLYKIFQINTLNTLYSSKNPEKNGFNKNSSTTVFSTDNTNKYALSTKAAY